MLDAATKGLMTDNVETATGAIGIDFEALGTTGEGEDERDFDSASAAASASQRAAIDTSVGEITLDYSKAGLKDNTKGQALANQPRPGAVPAQTSQEDLEYARRAGLPIPEASKTDSKGRVNARRTLRVSLLGIEDRITSVLAGLALGLLLSMWGGDYFANAAVTERRNTLLAELRESVTNPLSVDAGDLRTPPEIKRELSTVAELGTGTFTRWWLGLGIPIGLLLGLAQRRR